MTDNFNPPERFVDPEERKPLDIGSRKEKRTGFQKKSTGRSVGIGTVRLTSFLISILIWGLFLAVVGFGVYWVFANYSTGQ